MTSKKNSRKVKGLVRNPFAYLTVVLVFIAAFELVNLVQAGYIGPSMTPPGGEPATPLDTSSVTQLKEGNLVVGTSTTTHGVSLNNNGIVYFGSVDGVGSFIPQGGVSFDAINHVMQYATGTDPVTNAWNWVPFGTGNGSGSLSLPLLFSSVGSGNEGIVLQSDEYSGQGLTNTPFITWKSTMGNSPTFSMRSFAKNDGTGSLNFGLGDNSGFITFLSMDNQGNVSLSGPTVTQTSNATWNDGGWYGVGNVPLDPSGNAISQLSCDNDATKKECEGSTGGYKNGNANVVVGSYGYDKYQVSVSYCTGYNRNLNLQCDTNVGIKTVYAVYMFYTKIGDASAGWHLDTASGHGWDIGSVPLVGHDLTCDRTLLKDCDPSGNLGRGSSDFSFKDGTVPSPSNSVGYDAIAGNYCTSWTTIFGPPTCSYPSSVNLYETWIMTGGNVITTTKDVNFAVVGALNVTKDATIGGALNVGSLVVNGQAVVVPSGTMCGWSNNQQTPMVACQGHNPASPNSACPNGWSQHRAFSQGNLYFYACFKN